MAAYVNFAIWQPSCNNATYLHYRHDEDAVGSMSVFGCDRDSPADVGRTPARLVTRLDHPFRDRSVSGPLPHLDAHELLCLRPLQRAINSGYRRSDFQNLGVSCRYEVAARS